MKKGFTIIEMLMAVALTVLIGLLVAMAFNNTQKASQGAISTLQYELQGRAILDTLTRDISNLYYDSSVANTKPYTTFAAATLESSKLVFKTVLPMRRSRYTESVSNATGLYNNDYAQIAWYYVAPTDSQDLNADGSNDYALCRLITDPAVAARASVIIGNAINAGSPGMAAVVTVDNVVAFNDIRGFEFSRIPNTNPLVGNIKGIRIRFALTNLKAGSDDDTAVMSITNANYDTEALNRKLEAENRGYIWINFDRAISVKPYAP